MNAWQTAFIAYGVTAVISMFTAGLIKLIVVLLGMSKKKAKQP
jgi:hypothetical protein